MSRTRNSFYPVDFQKHTECILLSWLLSFLYTWNLKYTFLEKNLWQFLIALSFLSKSFFMHRRRRVTYDQISAVNGLIILGDPGAVSRARRKGTTKVFKHGRKSPWVPTLTGPFPYGQANTGSWLGTKNALYYCAQSANNFTWVLFVSSYKTAIISPQLPGSFTKLS